MDEYKKNNAVEKVENAIENKGETIKDGYDDKKLNAELRRSKKQNEKVMKEQIRADKRVEMARLKAHKKAEKEKIKAAALRDKNRRKAELKEKKLAAKEARKLQRDRQKSRRQERNKGNGGWLAAVISLGVATLVLASVLTFTFLMPSASDGMLEMGYSKSFYSTVEQVDNIDLNLSKVLATRDASAMQKYLVDTAINSEIAENELQQLPLMDESKHYTTKLVNQIGDFSKYLNNKLIEGEKLTEQDYNSLRALYNANLNLKNSLQSMMSEMGEDFSMMSMLDGGNGNIVINGFNSLENLSVEYPELIYDGPFSDGQENREIKGLTGAEIDEARAIEIFKATFADYNLENVMATGTTSKGIECYNLEAESKGEMLFAQISKKEGKLIMFSYAGSCMGINYSDEEVTDQAEQFLEKMNVSEMKPVWINLSNNVYTINFANEQNGVIVYGDLIKVRVCAETNMVIGVEAKSYYTNHTERLIGKASLTEAQAEAKLNENIEVETARLALVPIGSSAEKLCYEFSGKFDGETYYIYIDAVSGRQVEMFKVIRSTEGTLLM